MKILLTIFALITSVGVIIYINLFIMKDVYRRIWE